MKIFKGDDTGGRLGKALTITVHTKYDLTDCLVFFNYQGITRKWENVHDGDLLELFFSHNETAKMSVGTFKGVMFAVDPAGKYCTIDNAIPITVTTNLRDCYGDNRFEVTVGNAVGWENIIHKPFEGLVVDLSTDDKQLAALGTIIEKLGGTVKASIALLALCAATAFGYTPEAHTNSFERDGVTYAQRGGLGASDYVVTNIDASAVGKVQSVNGRVGDVVLDAAAVNALPDDKNELVRNDNFKEAVVTNALTVATTNRIAALETATNSLASSVSGLASSKADRSELGGYLPLSGGSLSGKVDGQGWWLDSGCLYLGYGLLIGGDNRPLSIVDYGNAYLLNDADGHKWFYGNPDEQDNEIAVKGDISATNPTFSNAVLAVQISTNDFAALYALKEAFADLPIDPVTGGISIGALLAALASAVAWLKKNKVGSFASVGGATATVENGVAKLDDFFTESNSFTPPEKVAGALKNSLLEKSIVLAVTKNFSDADTTAYGGQN